MLHPRGASGDRLGAAAELGGVAGCTCRWGSRLRYVRGMMPSLLTNGSLMVAAVR